MPRRTDFDPDSLAEVDQEYIRRSLGKNSSIITFPTEDISELTNLDSLITPSKETFPNIQKFQTLILRPGNQRLSFLIS